MPITETVTIINKSGKVVSTGKHLVNIFKDAKDAYQDKKTELKADHQARIKYKNDRKLIQAREETRSHPGLKRRHTDFPNASPSLVSGTLPPPCSSQLSRKPPRSQNSDFCADDVDMHLAYGKLPPDLQVAQLDGGQEELELKAIMSTLDELLLEAHCLQHSATAIIANLQSNPEAMAAVALTLAELSKILTKMSPGILTALKSSSPAVFALLASPQFLIASGVALGVTVVMFSGYKIIKKNQVRNEDKEGNRMEEALVYEGTEIGSIDTWRRGIADAEVQSVATSITGEFITPEAARQRKERIKERRREERHGKSGRAKSVWVESVRAESVIGGSVRSKGTMRKAESESTLRQRDIPLRLSGATPSESERSSKSRKESKRQEVVVSEKEKEKKKPSVLSVIFKRGHEKGRDIRESTVSHRPRVV